MHLKKVANSPFKKSGKFSISCMGSAVSTNNMKRQPNETTSRVADWPVATIQIGESKRVRKYKGADAPVSESKISKLKQPGRVVKQEIHKKFGSSFTESVLHSCRGLVGFQTRVQGFLWRHNEDFNCRIAPVMS